MNNISINLTVALSTKPLNGHINTNYLTAEDTTPFDTLAIEMSNALEVGSKDEIIEVAKAMTKWKERNNKIKEHEELIETVSEIIFNNTKAGDAIRPIHVAAIIKKSYPNLCEIECLNGNLDRKMPLGAVSVAINRLIDKVSFERLADTECYSRVYIRQ